MSDELRKFVGRALIAGMTYGVGAGLLLAWVLSGFWDVPAALRRWLLVGGLTGFCLSCVLTYLWPWNGK